MSDLPEFVREKWRTTFLPTLYDKFFTSDQPFDTFCKGSNEFVTLLQVIVEEVYPDFEYEAYNRVNEKRSSIGSNAITIVEKHLRTLEGEQAAKDWLRWSRRVDGPLFFKVPSPIDSPVEQNDPEYRFPEGRLLSPFVIGLAAPLLTLRTGSASDNGYPKGLVALIMAAVSTGQAVTEQWLTPFASARAHCQAPCEATSLRGEAKRFFERVLGIESWDILQWVSW
ncbi:hypothetical protein FPV67DRAFT_1409912 [Lyophyllum atratum]|nr:hypothetical protein FPV67DRAFT_1409912 [Lyophyllum atratum]